MLMILWMGGYRMLIAKTLSVDLCSTRTINLGGNEETSIVKLAKIVKNRHVAKTISYYRMYEIT